MSVLLYESIFALRHVVTGDSIG